MTKNALLPALALLLAMAGCVNVETTRMDTVARTATKSAPLATSATPGQMINALRARSGRAPLARSPQLDRAAAMHAADMARNDYYSHTSLNGDTVRERVEKAGFGSCLRAENIAWGQRSRQEVTQAWIDSRGHRNNIMHRKITHYGFAEQRNPGGKYDPIWVMVLATRDC